MKRAFIYLTLLAIALSLGLINAYLWRLQNRTQEHSARPPPPAPPGPPRPRRGGWGGLAFA